MYGKENTIGVQTNPEEGLVSLFPYYRVFSIATSVGKMNDPCPPVDRPERSVPPPTRGSFWEVIR